jgi:hypothetical protein
MELASPELNESTIKLSGTFPEKDGTRPRAEDAEDAEENDNYTTEAQRTRRMRSTDYADYTDFL